MPLPYGTGLHRRLQRRRHCLSNRESSASRTLTSVLHRQEEGARQALSQRVKFSDPVEPICF